ncbi:MAG TPA: alpha-glucosidase C-terminal domain-containing protein, partial [Chitinophagales bacterium]|nr:alpha-glucosidase C-terminal domain-containing protein [Chitinophagales bacterium]
DSHDTQRFTSFLHNPDIARFHTWGEYFNATKSTNLAYNVGKPTEEEYKRQMLMALFQYAYVGAPMLYYGDEVGMWGANDPDCRKPMVWQDMNYQPEQKLSSQEVRTPVDTVEVNTELLDYYRKLGKLRNMFDVLQTGDYQTIIADNKSGVYVFARSNNNLTVYVVLNNSAKEQKVKLNMPGMRYYYQPLESEITKIKKANVALTIPAVSGTVVFPFTLDECVNVTPEMMGK